MKKIITKTYVFFLLLMLWQADATVSAQKLGSNAGSPPSELSLVLELQDLPGLNAAGSYWEVSYQWRIANQKDFDRWSEQGEDTKMPVGMMLSKDSFKRGNLSSYENRRFEISIPVKGELRRQLHNAERQPQVLWLDATMRIHDATLGTDIIKKINPVWGPRRFYHDGKANVRIELMNNGRVRWSTSPTPPWVKRDPQNVLNSRKTP
jgi:hypothetical protein